MLFLPDIVPNWVSISFLMVIFIPVVWIARLAKQGAESFGKGKLSFWIIVLFYLGYFIYVSILESKGNFEELSLPPTILMWTMFPLLVVLMLFVFNTTIYKKILDQLKLEQLVQLHFFRLIGSFFIILAAHEVLPKSIGFIAGGGDIITALSSLWIAKALKRNKKYAQSATWIWNSFGLLDIVTTSVMALILTKASIDNGSMGVESLAEFPFCLIPAFAPATIIFLHFSIYRKLIKA